MNFSKEKTIQRLQSGEDLQFLFFWGHQETKEVTKSCFSQWYRAPFGVNEVPYATAEHFMMAEKALLFEDRESHELICKSTDPKEVKALGRGIKGFDQNTWE